MTIIYFFLILGVIVFIHELGHFIFAKKAGIYVYEFSIGMGPSIYKFKRKNDETKYSIRLLPIGGYVQMAGEEIEVDENIPKDMRIQSKTWTQRFLTIVAGVIFNFVLAIILFIIIGLVEGVPNNKPYIAEVDKNLPAYQTGLAKGDLILAINNKKIKTNDQLLIQLEIYKGEKIDFKIQKKNGTIEKYTVEPKLVEEEGVKSYKYGFSPDFTIEKGFFKSIKYGFQKTYSYIVQIVEVIGYLITGKLDFNSLSGPIGIYSVVGESAKAGFMTIVFLIAFMSVNVGVVNLIPFPAFDGGRLLFLVIEKIRRKPVDPKIENIIHSVGFFLLMVLIIAITYNDIIKIFR
ncbi:MAG TPA: RIP metalloprotease RseP [Tenericutes bacterium]|nr:RIP metalloprotease RseP [Mycoplasmatota bacterium]